MRGRPPKPTALKRLSGNPGKRKLNKKEPKPAADDSLLTPPSWLDPVAKGEWRRVAPNLYTLGLLTHADLTQLAAYCKAYSRWRQAEKALDGGLTAETASGYEQQAAHVSIAQQYFKQMHAISAHFGFTPASRTRLQTGGEDPKEDEYERFQRGRRAPAPTQEQEEDAPSRSLH